MEDFSPILQKSGLVQEEKTIKKDVDAILTRITNIMFSFTDVVSQHSDSILPDHEIDSQTHTSKPNLTNTSPVIWSDGSSFQDVVLTTSSHFCLFQTQTTNSVSGGIPAYIIPQRIATTSHYHTFICNNATCTSNSIVTIAHTPPQNITQTNTPFVPPYGTSN